jgi:predicted Zn finger-like uncharacterized protein
MPVITQCPSCSRKLNVPEDLLGKNVRCPSCGTTFMANEAPGGPQPRPPARPAPPSPPEEEERVASEPRRPRPRLEDEDYDREPLRYDEDYDDRPRRRRGPEALSRLKAPAICLMVTASLGLLLGLFNTIMAVAVPAPPPPKAGAQEDIVASMQRSAHGPVAAVMQGVFTILSAAEIFGAIAMLMGRMYGLAITTSILAMINFGSCCCLLGIPFGIWALVVLLQPDVKNAFG